MSNLTLRAITRMELSPGDVVVSAVAFRDYILVITQRGHIFRIEQEFA